MGATSDKLNKLLETKAAIRQAILDKGVEVGEDVVFADYANKINNIQAGGDEFFNARTQNGTNMNNLFYSFNGEFDFSSIDVSNAISMNNMFYYCCCTELDLSSWDVSNVISMNKMFYNCQATKIDIRNFDLNKISRRDMPYMLYTYRLRELRLDNCSYDTISKIVNNADLDISVLIDYEIDPETNLPDFEKEIIIQRKIYVNPDNIEGLAPPMNWVFVNKDTEEIIIPLYVPGQFSNLDEREKADITGVNVMVNDTHDDLTEMFAGCTNLTTINGIEQWDTSNVTSMNYTFGGCEQLSGIDVSNFNTSNVIDMGAMFCMCSSLTSLNVSNFDTSNVENMSGMFDSCSSLTELNVSNFNTNKVTEMGAMFFFCNSLIELDLSNFNTSNVEYMDGMFSGCNNLTELNLSNFDTSNVEYMGGMFYNCSALHTIRFDNCSYDTINKIINSEEFPTNTITGVTRKIYCKEANATGLTAPTNWVFEFVD